jgi:molybdopterin biosynthesis enzyme
MDGYAVRAADTLGATRESPTRLRKTGRVFTGEVSAAPLAPGTCCEIATGAPLPRGADAVVMVEDTSPGDGDDAVRVHVALEVGQHVGRRGGDVAAGETVLDEGAVITAARVGALAGQRPDVKVETACRLRRAAMRSR